MPLAPCMADGLPANWKITMEAFQEGYHVMMTHPQLQRAVPALYNSRYGQCTGTHGIEYPGTGQSGIKIRRYLPLCCHSFADLGQPPFLGETQGVLAGSEGESLGLLIGAHEQQLRVVRKLHNAFAAIQDDLRRHIYSGGIGRIYRCGDAIFHPEPGSQCIFGGGILHLAPDSVATRSSHYVDSRQAADGFDIPEQPVQEIHLVTCKGAYPAATLVLFKQPAVRCRAAYR